MSDFPFDSALKVLQGSGRETLPIPLLPDETQLAVAVGSWNPGTFLSVGGDVIVTNQRVIFSPLNVKDVTSVFSWVLGEVGAQDQFGQVTDWLGKTVGDVQVVGATETARAGSNARLLKPPTFVTKLADGAEHEVGVLWKRTAANIDPRNNDIRDQIVAAINSR